MRDVIWSDVWPFFYFLVPLGSLNIRFATQYDEVGYDNSNINAHKTKAIAIIVVVMMMMMMTN